MFACMYNVSPQLLELNPDAFQAGAVYPDAFYDDICYQGNVIHVHKHTPAQVMIAIPVLLLTAVTHLISLKLRPELTPPSVICVIQRLPLMRRTCRTVL